MSMVCTEHKRVLALLAALRGAGVSPLNAAVRDPIIAAARAAFRDDDVLVTHLRMAVCDNVPCNLGCNGPRRQPAPAKAIQLVHADTMAVCSVDGEPVVWEHKANGNAQRAHDAHFAALAHELAIEQGGMAHIKRIARCGKHGGGRCASFPGRDGQSVNVFRHGTAVTEDCVKWFDRGTNGRKRKAAAAS